MEMFRLHRIWAVVLRHVLIQTRDLGRMFDITFWPILDISIWGFTALWINQDGITAHATQVGLMLLVGSLFFQLIVRANIEISLSVLAELWSSNIANLLSSPLTLPEWLSAIMVISMFRSAAAWSVCVLVMWLLYSFNVFIFGWWLVPIFLLCWLSGWAMGLIAAGLIIRWGQRIESFVWAIGWCFTPFCGIFYPLEILPGWMKTIGSALPMTYIFKSMQEFIRSGTISQVLLLKSFLLGGFYLVCTLTFFVYMFTRTKQIGLAQLEAD